MSDTAIPHTSESVRIIELAGRRFAIIGTAHVSRESANEVERVIEQEQPDRVCIELDEARYRSMTAPDAWEKMDIVKIIKEGRAFLLLANLALSSFQRKMGADADMKPGEEMLAAVRAAEKSGIAWSFCDRDVQATLRRAWGKSNFWNKAKLVAQLVGSALSNEKPSQAEIERLKQRSELDEMMGELANYLPSVKEVLIDERDRYLASKIWASSGQRVVAVIGAGHAPGVEAWLARLASGEVQADVSDLETVPPPGFFAKSAGYLIPALIVGLIALGFFNAGAKASLAMLGQWLLWNGSLAAVGSLVCMAHPLTILVSFAAAPIATLNPLVAVGFFSGLTEAWLRKPSVKDFQNLSTDASTIKGFYRNKVTHILLVFFLSSLFGAVGNFIALPILAGGAL
ncbi:MAG TPA: TraB/GumN family protein [Spirochaetales bacterium]|nr:TraB/GumN family protein [Spirochaetales bacterium]